MSGKYWSAPRKWPGKSCAIVAGGPSVTQAAVNAVHEAAIPTIAINNSYQLAPWAEVLYFCDIRWWGWHRQDKKFCAFLERVRAGEAELVTLENVALVESEPGMRSMRNAGRHGLCRERDALANGANGGYQAINLAFHFGIKHLILLGYDMGIPDGHPAHWHPEHPVPSPKKVYSDLMLPAYSTLAPELEREGVVVHNCSPISALQAFPKVSLSDALRHAQSPVAHS